MTADDDRREAERLLDELAADFLARGYQEFVDFYMPHRVVVGESPLPASEIYGIRYDEDAEGFRVYHRDLGVKRVLMETGSWDDARALYAEKVAEQAAYLRGRS